MKCSHCGRRNKAGAIVCRNCGAALISPPGRAESDPIRSAEAEAAYSGSGSYSLEEYKKSMKKRKRRIVLGVIAGALLLLAACYLIFFAGNRTGQYLPSASGYTLLYTDKPTVLYRGRDALPGTALSSACRSIDAGTVGALDEDGRLILLRRGKSRSCDAQIADCIMADGGGLMVYRDNAGKLFAINCKKSDSAPVSVCSEAVLANYAVSPSGKFIVYNKAADKAMYLFTVSSGKESKLSSTLTPIALTDTAKTIYAYSAEDCSLYKLDRKGNSTYLRGGVGENIWLSFDHGEIAFASEASNGNVKTFVYSGGREYEVGAGVLDPVLTVSMLPAFRAAEGFSVITCPVKSFDGRLFAGDGAVRFGFAESAKLSELDIDCSLMSDDCRLTYFVSDGRLYRFDRSDEGSISKVCEDCTSFVMARNGSAVWCLSDEGKLSLVHRGAETAAAEGVRTMAVSPNGRELIYLKDGKAYLVKTSAVGKPREAAEADAVAFDARGAYLHDQSGWHGVTGRGRLVELTDAE